MGAPEMSTDGEVCGEDMVYKYVNGLFMYDYIYKCYLLYNT